MPETETTHEAGETIVTRKATTVELLIKSGEHIGQFFAYAHLPPALQEVSRPFAELALAIVVQCPRNPERTVALRKLLEAKDAAVRALVAKH
jgi:hypothetical protein